MLHDNVKDSADPCGDYEDAKIFDLDLMTQMSINVMDEHFLAAAQDEVVCKLIQKLLRAEAFAEMAVIAKELKANYYDAIYSSHEEKINK